MAKQSNHALWFFLWFFSIWPSPLQLAGAHGAWPPRLSGCFLGCAHGAVSYASAASRRAGLVSNGLSVSGSSSEALSLALRFCVSVVAEGDVDVEAIGVVDAEAEGVAKLDHVEVLADVEVVVVVDAGGDGVED